MYACMHIAQYINPHEYAVRMTHYTHGRVYMHNHRLKYMHTQEGAAQHHNNAFNSVIKENKLPYSL